MALTLLNTFQLNPVQIKRKTGSAMYRYTENKCLTCQRIFQDRVEVCQERKKEKEEER